MKESPIIFSGAMVRAILAGRKTQTRRLVDVDRLAAVVRSPIVEEINGHRLGSTKAGRCRVGLNPQGAVFKLGVRGKFGLKPEEFDFICPYVTGRTWLTPKSPSRSAPWTITPTGNHALWVRETWSKDALTVYPCPPVWYRADVGAHDDPARGEHSNGCLGPNDGKRYADCFACTLDGAPFRWRPSIFMPRSVSRITLEVTEIRVQLLQNISEEDAKAEGVERDTSPCDHTRVGCDEIGCLGKTYRSRFCELWDAINGKRSAWSSNPWVWCISFRRVS